MLTVKENLLNKFFTTTISVINRAMSINNYGEAVMVESTPIIATAAVQPTPGKELQFLPEFALILENISIFSQFELKTEGENSYSDIVIYNNNRYQVIKVKKWPTHYESVATAERLSNA